MSKDKKIVFSGGGSGGHSVIAMTLIEYFRSQGIKDIQYIGSYHGLEKDLAHKNNIPYHAISTGKLRRYFSFENFIDFFKFIFGVLQCFVLFLGKLRTTDIVFATGGFVSVPSAIAGKILGKKVYLHEQTSRLGLANKIISKFSDKIFVSFESTKDFISKPCIVSGYPIRSSFFNSKEKIIYNRPLLFITGGGNGSKFINDLVDDWFDSLSEKFHIIHQVGQQYINDYLEKRSENYEIFGFMDNLPQVLSSADLIISRAGAGIVSEILALKKKVLFIPLKIAQRNEQFHNAMEVVKCGHGRILSEDDYQCSDLIGILNDLENVKIDSLTTHKNKALNPTELIFQNL